MFLFLRFLLMLGVIMVALYGLLSVYARARCRARLKHRWAEQGRLGVHDTFVRRGLKRYDRSFYRRLLHLAYVTPAAVVLLIIYFINFR